MKLQAVRNKLIKSISNCTSYLYYYYRVYCTNEYSVFQFKQIVFWDRLFTFIATVIIWLCLLSVIGSELLDRFIDPLKYSSQSDLIIAIHPENTEEKNSAKVDVVMSYLQNDPSIQDVRILEQNEIVNIIDSFVNYKTSFVDIPLPIMISARINGNAKEVVTYLRLQLSQKVKNVYIDTEGDVLDRLLKPISGVKYFVFLVPIIIIFTLVLIMCLVIYAVLISHKDTIEIFLLLGMRQRNIVFEFARWVSTRSFQASLYAILFALVTMLYLVYFVDFDLVTVSPSSFWLSALSITFISPILAGLITVVFINKIIYTLFRTTKE